MGAAEAEILEDGVGVAREVAIGEEEEFGKSEQLCIRTAERPASETRSAASLGL
jgi:hypothetical protein